MNSHLLLALLGPSPRPHAPPGLTRHFRAPIACSSQLWCWELPVWFEAVSTWTVTTGRSVAKLRLERRDLWDEVSHDDHSQRGCAPRNENARRLFMKGVANNLCWMQARRGARRSRMWRSSYKRLPWESMATMLRCETRAAYRTTAHGWRSSDQRGVSWRPRRARRRVSSLDRLLAGVFDRGKETLEMKLPDECSWEQTCQGCSGWCSGSGGLLRRPEWCRHAASAAGAAAAAGAVAPPSVKLHGFFNALASAKGG